MVARTPPRQRRLMGGAHQHPPLPLNPLLIRETVNKVDKCMARLQELQYTVTGGNKVVGSGVSLSPRSTRGYLRTSLRCKQESLRIKSSAGKKSPIGKLPATALGEWRRMSLPAMLLGETMGEILQASQFAKELVAAVKVPPPPAIIPGEDPKTPLPQQRRKPPPNSQSDTVLKSKRHKEKQQQSNKLISSPPSSIQRRARSRSINFKVVSPPPRKRSERGESSSTTVHHLAANRVSPRNKLWGKKTVLFPNPLFHSSSNNNNAATTRSRSRSPPLFSRTNQKRGANTTPHKFLIKSPVKISPPKDRVGGKKKASPASPTRFSATATKLRRSFSPSRIANRLVSLSPLKGGRRNGGSSGSNVQRDGGGDGSMMMVNGKVSGLKQRPTMMVASSFSPRRFSLGRI